MFGVFLGWEAALYNRAWAAPRKPSAEAPETVLGDAHRALAAGDIEQAYELAKRIGKAPLHNRDYAVYVLAQSAFLLGQYRAALEHFQTLADMRGSRFAGMARWRVADCLWSLARYREAQRAYRGLVESAGASPAGDIALARFRIAAAFAKLGNRGSALRGFRSFLIEHPAHPLAAGADAELRALGGKDAANLAAKDRIARAQELSAAHLWHEAVAELALISDKEVPAVVRERDYFTALTYFQMRRRYADAGKIFLRIYRELGDRAAKALFHGARALSRADRDAEAIQWYQRLVAEYPRSDWAAEAQFLSGWLEFNQGNYAAAIPHLERMLDRYGKSRWADDARWFLGFSHHLSGSHERALPHFDAIKKSDDHLVSGQGYYWHARSLQALGRRKEAVAELRQLVGTYPFSWYAHLARARLTELGIAIGPFGDKPRDPENAPPLALSGFEALADDPLIRTADELIAASLSVEAGVELRRGERAFLGRHERPKALAMLMDRYRRAGNYNRPWMLAVVYGGKRALDAEPKGRARIWWEHAHPLAYRDLVERWRHLGDNPEYYLYAIMRKESGFDPHTLSYADAIGLMQMIPPTTRRVVEHLGLEYTDDLLYDPEQNIRTASWYIGRLLQKFKGQIPFGAGSFNCGPRAMMKWMEKNGDRPVDIFVELVSYQQTRGYIKKVTEAYSRYLYLYAGKVYEQPLTVDPAYLDNDINY